MSPKCYFNAPLSLILTKVLGGYRGVYFLNFLKFRFLRLRRESLVPSGEASKKRLKGPRFSSLPELQRKEFLNYLHQVNRSSATIDSYGRDLRNFLNWMRLRGFTRLESIGPRDISDYLEFLKRPVPIAAEGLANGNKLEISKGLSVTSRKRHLSTLKNFFGFLCEKYPKKHWWQRGFKSNPVLKRLHAIKVKDEDFDHTPLLRVHHWERLWESPLKERDRLFLALMYWGGLRVSEVRNLKMNQLRFDTNVLTFIRKGGKRHHLFLQDNGKCGLIWQRLIFKEENTEKYLFANRWKNGPLNRRGAYKRVKKAFQKAGLPQNLSPHSLRKACASRLYYQTKDLLFVRDYLGHADAKVTQTYIETQGVTLGLDESIKENKDQRVLISDMPGNSSQFRPHLAQQTIESSKHDSIQ